MALAKITWESRSYIGQGEKVLEHVQGVDTIQIQRHITQSDRVSIVTVHNK